ncbi:hypothetical protein OGATHE_001959 [Ogataea polymorpha]|uniref:Uncharacterized protein n=1 Tax=Ogataea polymorpha TaxID=460523 RepID=A0A9P8PMK4_9ASCO|nr:hypothetical protein OGATHE_001959 [Ogataea polymorpha]
MLRRTFTDFAPLPKAVYVTYGRAVLAIILGMSSSVGRSDRPFTNTSLVSLVASDLERRATSTGVYRLMYLAVVLIEWIKAKPRNSDTTDSSVLLKRFG